MTTISVTRLAWRGVAAWSIAGPRLELVLTEIGGHIAAIREPGSALNPLWQPQWPAGDPARATAAGTWGTGPEAPLLASIVGHNLCLDRFGAPWPGEDRPLHGEAGVVPWSLHQTGHGCELRTVLPKAGLRIQRWFGIAGNRVQVRTTVQHDGADDRSIEWAEHATLGDPFLDGAQLLAGIETAWTWPSDLGPAARWRTPLTSVGANTALAMPGSAAAPMGDILAAPVEHGWWRASRPDLDRCLEYAWDRAEWPWLCLWSEHRSRSATPWNGRERTRGMEFSTKPFPEGKPPAERAAHWLGRSTVCRVPPGAGLTKTFTMEWRRIGEQAPLPTYVR